MIGYNFHMDNFSCIISWSTLVSRSNLIIYISLWFPLRFWYPGPLRKNFQKYPKNHKKCNKNIYEKFTFITMFLLIGCRRVNSEERIYFPNKGVAVSSEQKTSVIRGLKRSVLVPLCWHNFVNYMFVWDKQICIRLSQQVLILPIWINLRV